MSTRRTIIGAMATALLITALPAVSFAQDEIADELGVSPEGVVWSLTSVGGSATPAEVEATLYLEGGEANGNGGCNSFSGTYELDGESLAFDPNMAITMALCEGEAQQVEDAYLPALATVAGWSIEGVELSLVDADGAVALTFEEPTVDLTETDITALVSELERLHHRISNTRQDVRRLNVESLRERVVANEAVLGEVSRVVQSQNVPGLRDRVVANEAVLNHLTDRFINVRARVADLERRVKALEKAVGLDANSQ